MNGQVDRLADKQNKKAGYSNELKRNGRTGGQVDRLKGGQIEKQAEQGRAMSQISSAK